MGKIYLRTKIENGASWYRQKEYLLAGVGTVKFPIWKQAFFTRPYFKSIQTQWPKWTPLVRYLLELSKWETFEIRTCELFILASNTMPRIQFNQKLKLMVDALEYVGNTWHVRAFKCNTCRYAIATDKSYKHALQLVISVWHCYGFAIYYLTSYLEINELFSWSTPYYFYAYFIGAKSAWAFIPLLVIIRCWRNICLISSYK